MLQAKVIELHRTRDFGRKLNATIEFIKQNFKPLFKSMLYISGPFVILGSLLITQVMTQMFSLATAASSGVTPVPDEFFSIFGYVFFGGLLLLIGTTAIVATIYDYMSIYEEKGSNDIEVNEVWERVKDSFWSVLGTMVLYALMFVGLYIVLLIPTFILGVISPALVFLTVIFVFIGLIYFVVGSSLIFVIRSYEKVSFGTALSRSFKLIKSNWWATLALVFVAGLIRGVISSIFFIPWYTSFIINMLDTSQTGIFEEPSLAMEIFNYVTLLLYMIMSTMLYSIPLIAIAFQYFNLVEQKEAKGLMGKIETFGTTENQEDEEEHY